MSKKKVIIILVIVAVLAAGVFAARSFVASRVAVNPSVMAESVKRETIITYVNAKGEVSLLNTELIYANTAAEVGEVPVEKNDKVKQGDVLIRYTEKSREQIENQLRDAELSLRSAELSLSQARIPSSQTQLESARLSVLSAEKSITELEYAMEVKERAIEDQKKLISDGRKALENAQALYNAGAASKDDLDKAQNTVTDLENALVNLDADYAQSAKSMDSLTANLEYQRNVYNEMMNKNSTPDVRNAIAQRQIAVEQAQNRVLELRKDLEDFQQEILSPIDGTVIKVDVSRGAITSTEYALMEIANVEDFIIKVDVNERNAAKIKLNQEVTLKGPVLGQETVMGFVSKIGGIAEQKQTTNGMERVVPVEITLNQSDAVANLKPGFSLDAVITTEVKENVLSVPILATLKDPAGDNFVYVVTAENTLEKRVVKLGAYSDMTVECEGVSEGELIVSQPTLDMTEGMSIEAINTDAPAEEEAPAEGASEGEGSEESVSGGEGK